MAVIPHPKKPGVLGQGTIYQYISEKKPSSKKKFDQIASQVLTSLRFCDSTYVPFFTPVCKYLGNKDYSLEH